MKRNKNVFQWFSDEMDINDEVSSRKCIVEIAGDTRVLIENHHGVVEYCDSCIGIKVKYGLIRVNGCNLKLLQMTDDKLVIAGKIQGIKLERGKAE